LGYYVRVLSASEKGVDLSDVRAEIQCDIVEPTEVAGDDWSSFTIRDPKGEWIAEITRDIVTAGSMAEEELAAFDDFLDDQEPKSGSDWAREYLRGVKTIYAFQINTLDIDAAGWRSVQAAKNVIHERVGGILQADNEGFSNAEGFHITWDFSDTSSGLWWMAVREADAWTTFQMDLSNEAHRAAFKAGRVPDGITPGEP
jgi:hypothetical protein